MKKFETEIAVIGAGSAGLSAAIQAASAGAKVLVIDENNRPGGQLFKQIHKFFGSRSIRQVSVDIRSAKNCCSRWRNPAQMSC